MNEKKITILYYTLGFNEDRGGGLTKYSTNLAEYENRTNDVVLLYPGEIHVARSMISIKYEGRRNELETYSIINPLPIPFLCGIGNNKYLSAKSDLRIWIDFLVDIKPDIIHIHTLIGLYSEFIEAAEKLNIPIIYTTHDYFGLCPKQTLIYKGVICTKWDICCNCAECNGTAISSWKLLILHSHAFIKLRKKKSIKKLRGKFKLVKENSVNNSPITGVDYMVLQKHFINIFKKVNYFHYNSNVARNVFEMILNYKTKGSVISIGHADIRDNRREKDYTHKILRLLYLGPPQKHKGYFFIINILAKIAKEIDDFVLNTYTGIKNDYSFICDHGCGYKYSELEEIMDANDLLLVPSQWNETFGFVIPEALSYGMPVLATPVVGASDLIKEIDGGFVLDNSEWENFLREIVSARSLLAKANRNILNAKFHSFEEHVRDITNMYKNILTDSLSSELFCNTVR